MHCLKAKQGVVVTNKHNNKAATWTSYNSPTLLCNKGENYIQKLLTIAKTRESRFNITYTWNINNRMSNRLIIIRFAGQRQTNLIRENELVSHREKLYLTCSYDTICNAWSHKLILHSIKANIFISFQVITSLSLVPNIDKYL